KYKEIGIEVKEFALLTSNNLIYWLFFPFFLCLDYLKLKSLIPQNSIIISSMFPMNYLASLLSKKTVYYCFEPFALFYDQDLIKSFSLIKQLSLNLLTLLYSSLDKIAALKNKYLITINPSVGKFVKKIYKKNPDDYSYLGVDSDFFNPQQEPLYKKKKSQVNLFHSTDYTPLKGTDYLIDAMIALKQKNVYLYISESVKNEQVKNKYLRIIKKYKLDDQIHFLGHLRYSDLPRIYSFCDIYCFTGDPDSQGATAASLSVLEASSSGLAIIRSIGNDDEIIEGKTGFFVDPRDTQSLKQVIEKLTKDKKLIKQMGKAGRRYILSKYQWHKVAQVISKKLLMFK
ncbi:MAG: glycosyltransferase, partial [Candidatus Woesebacteria bacterium]